MKYKSIVLAAFSYFLPLLIHHNMIFPFQTNYSPCSSNFVSGWKITMTALFDTLTSGCMISGVHSIEFPSSSDSNQRANDLNNMFLAATLVFNPSLMRLVEQSLPIGRRIHIQGGLVQISFEPPQIQFGCRQIAVFPARRQLDWFWPILQKWPPFGHFRSICHLKWKMLFCIQGPGWRFSNVYFSVNRAAKAITSTLCHQNKHRGLQHRLLH